MLSSIRKFSSSIYSKIFLIIVAIPFIFWGMGDLFSGGNLNTIVKIGNTKVSSKEFIGFIQNNTKQLDDLNSQVIESLLYSFVGQKLLEKEIENFDIKLTNESLALLIKNEELFNKDKKFSRTEYEKFLLNNNINAVIYEQFIMKKEKRKQLLDLIGGGVIPSEFMVNLAFNKVKQERNVKLINLNKVLIQKTAFTKDEINLYYENNRTKFQDIHKIVKYIELKPNILIGKDDFNSLFFEKIDEIDDLVVEGKNLKYLIQKYTLGEAKQFVFNKNGNIINQSDSEQFLKKLVEKINNLNDSEPIVLVENENTFLLVELIKIENIEKKITDSLVLKTITKELQKNYKRKKVSDLISKIGNKTFVKENFYSFAKKENAIVESVKIKDLNDDSYLKVDLVGQIYLVPEDKVIVVSDIGLEEVFLVHVESVKNRSINENSEDYDKYFKLAKTQTASSLFNSYDKYLKNKYEININYKALEQISNSF